MSAAPPATTDPHDLRRFVVAQAPVFESVLAELRAGQKRTHWMWVIFPQIAGLARSEKARHFSIMSRAEAVAYLDHAVLGPRLREAAAAAMTVPDRSANTIFGSPDDNKLRSCATLFDVIEPKAVFDQVLAHFFKGVCDATTISVLQRLHEVQ
jgi:uncharacterized protein (DUF1810 family)